jgi:pyruvate,orthophosphate dikinase
MLAAHAIITETGGSTSHAAVVSRALGLPCVVGCGSGSLEFLSGRIVTVDGALGRIFEGALDVVTPDETSDERLTVLTRWAKARSRLIVHLPSEAPSEDLIDLNTVEGGEDLKRLPGLIRGYRGARGGAIASDEGIRAALQEKLEFVVGEPVLPLLIAAIRSQTKKAAGEMLAAETASS